MGIREANAAALVRAPYDGQRYRGLDREAASRQAVDLCQAAADTGMWKHLPEHLSALRGIVIRDNPAIGLPPMQCQRTSDLYRA